MLIQQGLCILQHRRLKAASSSSSGRPVSRRCHNVVQQQQQQMLSLTAGAVSSAAAVCATSALADAYTAAQHPQHQALQRPGRQPAHCTPHSSSSSSSRQLPLHKLLVLLQCRPACEQPALLTAAIKAVHTWQEAAALYSRHSDAFNHIHTAALISQLPKVVKAHPPLHSQEQSDLQLLLQDLAQLAEEVLPDCSGRELANMAHGFAALGAYSRRLMQLLLGRCDLATLKPQELANLTWAVAKLRHEMHEGWTSEVLACSQRYMVNPTLYNSPSQQRQQQQQYMHSLRGTQIPRLADRAGFKLQASHQLQQSGFSKPAYFKPQELVNMAWALAAMQQHCQLSSAPPLRHSCTRVGHTWLSHYFATAAALLPTFTPADVAVGLWAMAVLGAGSVPQQWLDGQLQHATAVVGQLQGRHIAMLLWATSQVLRQQQQHAHFKDDTTSVTNGSSSNMLVQEFGNACFPRLLELLKLPEQQQRRQHLQLVCVVLMSAARLGLKPPAAVMHRVLQAAAMQLQQCSKSSWHSMQQQRGELPGSSSSSKGWQQQQQQRQQQHVVRLHDVSSLLYSLAKLQYCPSQWFLAAAMHAVAVACWQQLLATQQHRQQQQQQQQQSSPTVAIQPREVAILLWAMGKLYCRPPATVLRLLYKITTVQGSYCTSCDISVMFWGLARLRARPRHVWVELMVGHFLLRIDDGLVACADICNVVHALPHLPGGEGLNAMLRDKLAAAGHLQQLAAVAQQRFDECGPCELVQLVQGFARLGFRPDHDWMSQHELRCDKVGVAQFSDRERDALAAARAMLMKLPQQQQQQQHRAPEVEQHQQPHVLQHQQRVRELAAVR